MSSKITQIFFVMLFISLVGLSFGKYNGGTGEPNNPYLISTPNDLNSIGLNVEDFNKCFLMVADINLVGFTGEQFNIIGPNSTTPFIGVFDGNGHTISNFTYSSTGTYFIGIFGFLAQGKILSCNIIDCNVSGRGKIGGLVGLNLGGEIHNSSASGKINGSMNEIGGLVGVNCGLIQNCWSSGSVVRSHDSWNKYVGGLVGYNVNGGQVIASFAGNEVLGHSGIGGLIGGNDSSIVQNCYSFSNVDANERAGGLIGSQYGSSVSWSYSCGVVSPGELIGAFAGSFNECKFLGCFWDIGVNRDVNGLGDGSDPNVVGLPTAQMQQRSTFADAGWDVVNVWDIGENQTYPFLRTHLPSDINKDDETNFYDLAILAEHWRNEK